MLARRETDQERAVVGLNLGFVRGTVSVDLPAFGATVNDHKALLGIGLGADRLHWSAAFICAISRIDIHMQRPKAKRAMVARGVAQGLYGFSAMLSYKAVIVFGKSFLLHFSAAPIKIKLNNIILCYHKAFQKSRFCKELPLFLFEFFIFSLFFRKRTIIILINSIPFIKSKTKRFFEKRCPLRAKKQELFLPKSRKNLYPPIDNQRLR